VTTIHDVAYLPYPESYSRKSRWYLDFAAKLAKKLPLILTVSEFSKNEITKYYRIEPERIAVTPLGFSHEETSNAQVVKTKYRISDPFILYVGRLERKKNVAVIVDAFNLIKDEAWGAPFELVLVGVKGHGWEEIEKTIAASPYKDAIKLIGWVTEQEKHALLAEAKAFILLSAYEGFGIPLLEAMAARTPIITSNQAALPEVGGTATFTVPRGKPAKVRDALKELLFNDELRMTLIARGEDQMKQFSWQRTARLTYDALDTVLKSHPGL
jgi:glycosyltransferase involved in cell wall biosynthesis